MNLCYQALDHHVVHGRADEPAIRAGERCWSVAETLEYVAALAGALSALGAEPGTTVAINLTDPVDELMATLAVLRLGATVVDGVHLADCDVAVSSQPIPVGPRAVIARGFDPTDEVRELAWDLAIRAGRTQPAGVARSQDATVETTVEVAIGNPRIRALIATMIEGELVTLVPD